MSSRSRRLFWPATVITALLASGAHWTGSAMTVGYNSRNEWISSPGRPGVHAVRRRQPGMMMQ